MTYRPVLLEVVRDLDGLQRVRKDDNVLIQVSGSSIDQARATGQLGPLVAEISDVVSRIIAAGVPTEDLDCAVLRQKSRDEWELIHQPITQEA